jgi:hypothetical protein
MIKVCRTPTIDFPVGILSAENISMQFSLIGYLSVD